MGPALIRSNLVENQVLFLKCVLCVRVCLTTCCFGAYVHAVPLTGVSPFHGGSLAKYTLLITDRNAIIIKSRRSTRHKPTRIGYTRTYTRIYLAYLTK